MMRNSCMAIAYGGFHGLACGYLFAIALSTHVIAQEESDNVWCPKSEIACIDFSNKSGAITIPVKIGGIDRLLLLDTGCTRTILDTSLLLNYAPIKDSKPAPTRIIQSKTKFLNGDAFTDSDVSTEVRFYKSPEMHIGDVALNSNISVLGGNVRDSLVRKAIGIEFDGLLGMDQLCAFGLHIDYDHKKIILFNEFSEEDTPPGTPSRLFYRTLNVPVTTFELDGKSVYAAIDTGNVGEEIALSKADFNKIFPDNASADKYSTSVNHSIFKTNSKSISLNRELRWGDHTYHPVKVALDAKWSMLGSQFLMRHRLTFKFKQSILFIAHGDTINYPRHFDFDGIVVDTHPDGHPGLPILEITPGSIAEKLGLRPEDRLITIGRTTVAFSELAEISRIICFERKDDLEVKVLRGADTLSVKLPRDTSSRGR